MLCAARRVGTSTWLRVQSTNALARANLSTAATRMTLDTPFISDTIPLAEGVLGTVEELIAVVGQSVVSAPRWSPLASVSLSYMPGSIILCAQERNQVVAVIETDKVALDVKASRSGVIEAVLVNVGDEVKEQQPIYRLKGDD